ncbi:TetR/AcrR family transcriptional regulator [Amnibacterium sp. CER49]|uniref:TetR/AcrR family transcriptional regulator n=1 Tax=Amnibacterium sp. CER49 TaxID=3039161 RepID=UPI00244AAAE3|nr:TetR/AcrR family transcriptional regulator [Amnibacterium sp. CER49]MDH2442907.1 TetR/AcrR family transcriptional regulator [Amnibacterium sp. CER49]
MPSGASQLVQAALRSFAASGFEGASLQRIADAAGLSKSSVLYHFDSKEALLDAALRPAVVDLRDLLGTADLDDPAGTQAFLARFVDFLFAHRLEVAVLVNHGSALRGQPVVDEADALVVEVAHRLRPADASDRDAVRFGVALAGAAFVLVGADRWATEQLPDEELRPLLAAVLAELVLPAAPQPA